MFWKFNLRGSRTFSVAAVVVVTLIAAACTAEPVIIEKEVVVVKEVPKEVVVIREVVKEVPREVVVIKEVVKEVEVEKPFEVIKEVIKEVPVERIITVIATAVPAAKADLTPRRGGILRRYQPADTGIFIPYLAKAQTAHYFIFDPIVEYDDRGELLPNLATTWEVADDSTSITFNLRNDVKWHDGEAFTADDIVFTMSSIMDQNTVGKFRSQLTVGGMPITWTALDNTTVRMNMPVPFAPVMGTLSEIGIVPEHILTGTEDVNTDPFNLAPIGTGPFKVREVVADSHVETEAASQYHNGVPFLDKMFHLYFPEADAAAAALLTNQIDSMWAFPEQQGQFERSGSDKVVRTYAYWQAITLGFNQAHPALEDKRVREAIRWGIESKQEWTDIVTRGRGETADVYLAIASPLNQYNPPGSMDPLVGNLDKARQLLEDAGWKVGSDGIREKGGMKLSLASPWGNFLPEYGEGNEILQASLAKIGIEVKPRPADSSLLNDLQNDSVEGWQDYAIEIQEWAHTISRFEPDWSGELTCDARVPNGRNYMNYCNPEVDRLLEEGKSTFDPAERQAAYRRIQEILHDDVAAVPLYFVFDALVTTARVQGIPADSPASRYYFRRFPERVWVNN